MDFVIQVAVLSNDSQLEEALRSAGLKAGRVGLDIRGRERAGHPRRPRSWSTSAASASCRQVCASFRKQYSGTGIVLIASSLDPHMMLEAMRAGVSRVPPGTDHATVTRSGGAAGAR